MPEKHWTRVNVVRELFVRGDHRFSGKDPGAAMVGPERKHLSEDALFSMVHTSFAKILDHRVGRPVISLADALMSAFAMFSLGCPSLLQFDEQQRDDEDIRSIYRIGRVPRDTQMRTIIDPLEPEALVHPDLNEVFPLQVALARLGGEGTIRFRALQRSSSANEYHRTAYREQACDAGLSVRLLIPRRCHAESNERA